MFSPTKIPIYPMYFTTVKELYGVCLKQCYYLDQIQAHSTLENGHAYFRRTLFDISRKVINSDPIELAK